MEGAASSLAVPRVLVAVDEADVAAMIVYQLAREGFRVETARSSSEALDAIAREIPDLIVIDRMLPGLSGDGVLKRLRADPVTSSIPVLVLTAEHGQEDRIAGLGLHADDHLTKPFSPSELVLRAQAILRRARESGVTSVGRVLRAGPIRIDLASHRTLLDGKELRLTPTEFRLLRALVERRGSTQTRKQLLERAWDVDAGAVDRIETRTVDMYVRRLRAKLGAAGEWIQTIRGFGYRLKVPDGVE